MHWQRTAGVLFCDLFAFPEWGVGHGQTQHQRDACSQRHGHLEGGDAVGQRKDVYKRQELGNRTLMMDAGRIVFDVKGEARSKMTVDDLLEKFRENAGKALDNDRILLSKVEANN